MNTSTTLQVAERAFAEIAAQFPSLRMEREDEVPVELSVILPVQVGLKHEVRLNLQNTDELHFAVGHFWLEWFPCTEPQRVQSYVAAVCGFLSGAYRILEHYRGRMCVRAELQAPTGSSWRTVGTWSNLMTWLPYRRSTREVRNA